jgi:hypothetical protein
MSKPVKTRKVRERQGRTLVTLPRETIYFKSGGDPKGVIPVQKKHEEAEALCCLLLVGIARSGIPLDLLDLPGSAQSIRDHVMAHPQPFRTYMPGESVVHQAVAAIQEVRQALDEEHKKAVAARLANAKADGEAQRQGGHQPEAAVATVH